MLDSREGSIVFGVQTKLEPLPIGTFSILKIIENGIKLKRLQPPKV
jgi:hypothetical protein